MSLQRQRRPFVPSYRSGAKRLRPEHLTRTSPLAPARAEWAVGSNGLQRIYDLFVSPLLDPQARLAVWRVLDDLKRRGVTLLITTHYMEEAERICDRLVILDEGRIVAAGTPSELLSRYEQETLEGVFLELTGHSLRE